MNASEEQAGQKRIEDLTIKEVDMSYSLARVGEWTDLEIGKRYGISKADVREVIANYEELRMTAKKGDASEQGLATVTAEEGHRVRRNARYGSNRERQAAYRARVREKCPAEMPQPATVTDAPPRPDEELPPGNQHPLNEVSPEDADP